MPWLLRQSLPLIAPARQASAQAVQLPHSPSIHGSPKGKGAFVTTVAQDTQGPSSGWINSPLRPTQPRPAQVAAALCENRCAIRALNGDSMGSHSAGQQKYRYPRKRRKAAISLRALSRMLCIWASR